MKNTPLESGKHRVCARHERGNARALPGTRLFLNIAHRIIPLQWLPTGFTVTFSAPIAKNDGVPLKHSALPKEHELQWDMPEQYFIYDSIGSMRLDFEVFHPVGCEAPVMGLSDV